MRTKQNTPDDSSEVVKVRNMSDVDHDHSPEEAAKRDAREVTQRYREAIAEALSKLKVPA